MGPDESLPENPAPLVLVVDDEADVRELVREILKPAGIAALAASDGEAALGLLREAADRIDLVLTDVMMPVVDGPTLARRVQKDYPSLPVLFMTGYPRDTLAGLGMLAEDLPRIEKPFRIRELVERVRAALKG